MAETATRSTTIAGNGTVGATMIDLLRLQLLWSLNFELLVCDRQEM